MDLSEISSLGETEAFFTSCGGFLLSKVCVSTILSNKSFNVTLLSLAGCSSILMSSSISMNDFFIGVSDFEFMIDGDESIEALRDIRSSNLSPINRLSGLLLDVFGFFSLDNNKLLKNAFDDDFFGDGVIGIGLDVEGLFLFSINSPSVRFFRFCLTISGSFLVFE